MGRQQPNTKLVEKDREEVRRLFFSGEITNKSELARIFSVSRTLIRYVLFPKKRKENQEKFAQKQSLNARKKYRLANTEYINRQDRARYLKNKEKINKRRREKYKSFKIKVRCKHEKKGNN